MKFNALIVLVMLASCQRYNNTHVDVRTEKSLNKCQILFERLDFEDYNIDLSKFEGKYFNCNDVIPDNILSGVVDKWGNPMLCMYKNGKIYFWSSGKNRINDMMTKDDIVRSVKKSVK